MNQEPFLKTWTPLEDMIVGTKTSHQKLGLVYSKASPQKIHDFVLGRKCA